MTIKQDTLEKINLCFSEIEKCRQLLNNNSADDFCGRLLSIYIMIRIDDISKMWSHSITKGEIERLLSDEAKTAYNKGFRNVRDKLGAHYQTPSDNEDISIFESSILFRSFDFESVSLLIDEFIAAEQLINSNRNEFTGFDNVDDLMLAIEAIDNLYADDKSHITNSALDLFGINKVGVISCSNGQRKAQFLKGVELMVDYAYHLANRSYHSIEVQRLFKRMLVCFIYNYHDNLFTRKELNLSANQYEEGFDTMYKTLYSPCDNKTILDTAFEEFEKIYQTDEFFKRNRKVRDRSCAHFDEKCNVDEINSILDELDHEELYTHFCNMLNLFNFICNNMRTLSFLQIPPRSVLYNVQIENMDGITNFFGEKPNDNSFFKMMSPKDILKSIRKKDIHYEEALEQMKERLFSQNLNHYHQMIAAIGQRLHELTDFTPDLFDIIDGLYNAKRGYPNRLQRSIVELINDNKINGIVKVHLIWVLSSICIKDEGFNVLDILQDLIKCDYYPIQCLAFIGYLHYLMSDRIPFVDSRIKPREVDIDFKHLLQTKNNPTLTLGIWLALNQHWMCDSDYLLDRKRETDYDSFLKIGLHDSLQNYCKYAKVDENNKVILDQYEITRHYLLLLQMLTRYEIFRNQKPNVFLELWNSNCFIKYRTDLYESIGVGLMTELNGEIEIARNIFKTIVKDNPINQDAIDTLAEFEKRNKKE